MQSRVLVRSALHPVNGWRPRGGSGKARAARAWKSNGGRIWLAVGTHSKL